MFVFLHFISCACCSAIPGSWPQLLLVMMMMRCILLIVSGGSWSSSRRRSTIFAKTNKHSKCFAKKPLFIASSKSINQRAAEAGTGRSWQIESELQIGISFIRYSIAEETTTTTTVELLKGSALRWTSIYMNRVLYREGGAEVKE